LAQLRETVEELYEIGDCVGPAKVSEAIQSGFVAGWRI
jgi:hypothetical protein